MEDLEDQKLFSTLYYYNHNGVHKFSVVDSHQISLEASQMLQILDLSSLAHLAGCER